MKKRTKIELHCHTKMSAGKGLIEPGELVKYAFDNGYKAIAITDCGSVQAFPKAYRTWKKLWEKYKDECKLKGKACKQEDFLKVIYGLEGFITGDLPLPRENMHSLMDECTVIDITTTGFSVKNDSIICIDAVKIKNGKIKESFSSYILQEKEIPENIIKITGITKDKFKDAKPEKQVINDLYKFIGNSFLTMQHSSFYISFLKKCYEKYGLSLGNDYIDLYKVCKYFDPEERMNVQFILEKYQIKSECSDNYCMKLAKIYIEICKRFKHLNVNTIEEADIYIDKAKDKRKRTTYPILLYAKNEVGIRNLYKIVTESKLMENEEGQPLIIQKKTLDMYREGILVGSPFNGGEAQNAIYKIENIKPGLDYMNYRKFFKNILSYYDFIEMTQLRHLEAFPTKYMDLVQKNKGVLVAASDAYYLYEEDKIYWDILTNGKNEEKTDCPRHLLNWDEMKDAFECSCSSDSKMQKQFSNIAIDNQSVIADQIEYVSPMSENRYLPIWPEGEEQLRRICETKARELFHGELPEAVRERLDLELNTICNGGYAGIYMMWRALVSKSIEKGYPVSAWGCVASSLVAYLSGITEINPLPEEYGGCNIPVETLMGLAMDNEPNFGINFAYGIKTLIQNSIAELPCVEETCHAGTILTISEKVAEMIVKEYYYHKNLSIPDKETLELQAKKICGVKNRDGCHPTGILIMPEKDKISLITPLQDPLNDNRITSHFDYHDLMDNLIKMDILGHQSLDVMQKLQELTGISVSTIPMKDEKVLAMLCDLECTKIEDLPEFGSESARLIIKECKAKTYDDLIKVYGLMHGTGVWQESQRELILNDEISIKDCIALRDDIYLNLIARGLDKASAYNIMESVRRGKGLTEDMIQAMREVEIPEWYIETCKKVKYLFSKAHAVSTTLMVWRLAYYKVYYPEIFECAIKLVI